MLNFNKAKNTMVVLAGLVFFTACNKELPEAVPIEPPPNGTTPTIATLLDDPSFSILKAAVTKAGLMPTLADPALRFTLFAPDDAAFIASGISLDLINQMPAQQVAGLVMYHIDPQILTTTNIPDSFSNLQYPSLLNPAPSISPLLRLTNFPSKRGSIAWVNNIPIVAADIPVVNGVVHKVARAIGPPTKDLWSRISTDPNLTYLKAAIDRADSGAPAGGRLQDALNIGANPAAIASNLTIFAPTDAAFRTTLTGAIYQALLPIIIQQLMGLGYTQAQAEAAAPAIALAQATALASTPDVFSNPALFGALSARTVKGIVVYHILGRQAAPYTPPGIRVFSVNVPTAATHVNTLLNSAVPHPGLTVQATFGPIGVTGITVKGAANSTASNVLIDPNPGKTSDQHYVNGVIHIIDQVLRPQ